MLKRLGPLFDKAIFSGVKNDIGTFISSSAGSRSQELGFALFASFALASSANFCSLVSIGNSNFSPLTERVTIAEIFPSSSTEKLLILSSSDGEALALQKK